MTSEESSILMEQLQSTSRLTALRGLLEAKEMAKRGEEILYVLPTLIKIVGNIYFGLAKEASDVIAQIASNEKYTDFIFKKLVNIILTGTDPEKANAIWILGKVADKGVDISDHIFLLLTCLREDRGIETNASHVLKNAIKNKETGGEVLQKVINMVTIEGELFVIVDIIKDAINNEETRELAIDTLIENITNRCEMIRNMMVKLLVYSIEEHYAVDMERVMGKVGEIPVDTKKARKEVRGIYAELTNASRNCKKKVVGVLSEGKPRKPKSAKGKRVFRCKRVGV